MARTMKKRVFCGSICEQIVYNVPEGIRDVKAYDPEKPGKKRFKDEKARQKHKEGIARRKHYRKFMANFKPGDLFITLTFDSEWEVTDFDEAKQVRNNWRRVLQRAYPDAVFFIYMGRGNSTHRIHFHMVCTGIPKEFIEEKWKYGKVRRIAELRAHCWYDGTDMGADYHGLANYCFDHWKQEQGGHRYFCTRNAREPEAEEPTEVHIRRGYSDKRPPVAPKGYRLTVIEGNEYGYCYYRYVAEEQKPDRRPVT